MLIELRRKGDKEPFAYKRKCDGCGDLAREVFHRDTDRPLLWAQKTEEPFNDKGQRQFTKRGLVINDYCLDCFNIGVTARTGAAERRKQAKLLAKKKS